MNKDKFARHSDQEVIGVLKMVKSGVHPTDVAKQTGIHVSSIYTWCKKAHVDYEKRTRTTRNWEKIVAAL